MTQNNDKALDQILSEYKSPAPSDLLTARILKAAQNTAQDVEVPSAQSRRFWPAAIAACLCAVFGLGFYTTQFSADADDYVQEAAIDEEALWLSAANDLDMIDVFLWVEAEA